MLIQPHATLAPARCDAKGNVGKGSWEWILLWEPGKGTLEGILPRTFLGNPGWEP